MPYPSHYEQPVSATIQLLKQLDVKVTNSSVNNVILSHPDYPSLLCISDSLTQWNVENAALTLDKESLEQYPLPFLAFIGRNFRVITGITGDAIVYLDDDGKTQKENKDKFLKHWGGVALIAQASENAGEKDYAIKKLKERNKRKIFSFGAIWILLCLSGSIFLFAKTNVTPATIGYASILFLKLTGTFIAFLLLWYEVDKYNPTLQKICAGSSSKKDCSAILSAPAAKIFKVISWSEIGFFYFAGGFLALLLNSTLLNGIVLLNVLALPYILYSLAYQKLVAKQWCRLCLMVLGVLLLEFIAALSTNQLINPFAHPFINFPILAALFTCFSLPVVVWYIIKPILLKNYQNKNKGFELARLKNNPKIFTAMLHVQKRVSESPDGLGIMLGNLNAENTIIEVCNPYCGPCAKAHKEIDKLLEHNTNLKVQLLFTATNEPGDKLAAPVKHLLAINSKGDAFETRRALDGWWQAEKKDYAVFADKYRMNGEINQQGEKIEAMNNWCKAMEIVFTPTIFINGYQLPELYGIDDLNILLNQLHKT